MSHTEPSPLVSVPLLKLFLDSSASAGMEAKLKGTQLELQQATERIAVLESLTAEQHDTIETLQASLLEFT